LTRTDLINTQYSGCFNPSLTLLSDTVFDCDEALTNPNYVRFQFTGYPIDSVAVTALDTVKPVLLLQTDTLYLNNPSGMDSISFMDVDKGSVDNCALDSATLNGMSYAVFGCADLGAQKVIVNLYDASGNLSVDSTTVYVIDTVTPVYIKTPYTANLVGDSAVVSRTDILSNATGGCFPPKLTILSDTVFYCKDIATNPNYIRFQFTGSTVDSVEVTVKDTTLPTVQLMSDTLYVNIPGDMDTLRFANIDAGTTDNCGIDSTTINGVQELYYGCSDTGAHKIIAHVWDVNGNFSSDSAMVYVLDTVSPTYTKLSPTVYLISDSVALSRSDILTNVSGGCSTPVVQILSDTVFDCLAATQNPNYVKFSINGSIIDSSMVTVLDTVSPVLLLATDTLYASVIPDTLTFSRVDNGSYDNCGLDSATVDGSSHILFGCDEIGSHTINVKLYDLSGNVSMAMVSVEVVDTITPQYAKVSNVDAFLTGTTASVSRDELFTNVGGGCAPVSVTFLSDTVFGCVDVQTNPNFVKYQFPGQPIDSVMVTVLDTTPPELDAKNLVNLVLSSSGTRTLTMFDLLNSIPVDSCGLAGVTINPPLIDCGFTSNYNPVVVTATDVNGNSDSATVFVLAQDITPPTLAVKTTQFYLDPLGNLNLDVNDLALAKDSCGIDTLFANQSLFSCADTGMATVQVTAIDANNNTVTTFVQITIQDTIAPSFTTPLVHTVYLNAFGQAQLNFSDVVPGGVIEACGLQDTLLSKTVFGCSDILPQFVSVTAIDLSGNSSTQNVLVNANDTVSPILTTKQATVIIDSATGMATVDFSDVTNVVFDNCLLDSTSFVVFPSTFNCDSIGLRTVTVQVKDIYGNTTTRTANVTVLPYDQIDFNIVGPNQVCENAYNVKYQLDKVNEFSNYQWTVVGGKIVSTSFKGREAYIHWNSSGPGYITVQVTNGCVNGAAADTVFMSGMAPDTATVVFWNPSTKTTLVSTDKASSYYQWGYDYDSSGVVYSKTLVGETANAYYNFFIEDNILNNNYRYWCETSLDGSCWTRSYLNSQYPIDIKEEGLDEVNVWPVPFSTHLNVRSRQKMQKLELVDLYGKTLISAELRAETEARLEGLEKLPSASYILRITYKNGRVSNHKIVHQK
jgi:hypothetical protein